MAKVSPEAFEKARGSATPWVWGIWGGGFPTAVGVKAEFDGGDGVPAVIFGVLMMAVPVLLSMATRKSSSSH